MYRRQISVAVVLTALSVAHLTRAETAVTADARRGERLLTTHACEQCHSVGGKGGSSAPDLGRPLGRDYTPEAFAARMWNHAPAMWSAMERQDVTPTGLTEQDSADLFGYFYSVRFFDTAADAGRGKRLFQEKRCGECHGSAASGTPAAKPVAEWQSASDPIELASALWNHAWNMRQSFASRKIPWPDLTGQDISDIALYARSHPSSRGRATTFKASGEGGEALFESKGCAGCHAGSLSLNRRLRGMTLNDIAAAMWSHAGKMGVKPSPIDASEMSRLVTWLWSRQVLASGGSAARGKSVFAAKGCSGCHSGGALSLAAHKASFSTVSMVASLWDHGPRMLDEMKQKDVKWPRLTPAQMSDLIAYVNAGQ